MEQAGRRAFRVRELPVCPRPGAKVVFPARLHHSGALPGAAVLPLHPAAWPVQVEARWALRLPALRHSGEPAGAAAGLPASPRVRPDQRPAALPGSRAREYGHSLPQVRAVRSAAQAPRSERRERSRPAHEVPPTAATRLAGELHLPAGPAAAVLRGAPITPPRRPPRRHRVRPPPRRYRDGSVHRVPLARQEQSAHLPGSASRQPRLSATRAHPARVLGPQDPARPDEPARRQAQRAGD